MAFDDWTRALGAAASRRATAHALAGGILGAVLSQLGMEDAAGACVKLGKQCVRRGKKLTCCGGAKCRGGRCTCIRGAQRCGSVCCRPNQVCGDPRTGACVTGRGRCRPGDDFCDDVSKTCDVGNGCTCYTTIAGATRCASDVIVESGCGDCDDDADCHPRYAQYGPGAFCARRTGINCCPANVAGKCVMPCPT